MRTRKWTHGDLAEAVATSCSIRQAIAKLGLVPAGGNYQQVSRTIKTLKLDTSHFSGRAWSKGKKIPRAPLIATADILVEGSDFQSNKLKKRLFKEGIKKQECEICGWAARSEDGRVPLELDHINGDRRDNRLMNLRILCPNCHSLQPTHRGKNMGRRDGGTGIRATLKMS